MQPEAEVTKNAAGDEAAIPSPGLQAWAELKLYRIVKEQISREYAWAFPVCDTATRKLLTPVRLAKELCVESLVSQFGRNLGLCLRKRHAAVSVKSTPIFVL